MEQVLANSLASHRGRSNGTKDIGKREHCPGCAKKTHQHARGCRRPLMDEQHVQRSKTKANIYRSLCCKGMDDSFLPVRRGSTSRAQELPSWVTKRFTSTVLHILFDHDNRGTSTFVGDLSLMAIVCLIREL